MLGLQLIYVSKRAPRKLAVLKKNIEINELWWTLGNTLVHSRRKGCLIHVFCDHSTGGKTPLSENYPFHKESVSWKILTSTVQAFGKGWTGKCCCISWKKSIQMFSLPVPIIISLFLILLISLIPPILKLHTIVNSNEIQLHQNDAIILVLNQSTMAKSYYGVSKKISIFHNYDSCPLKTLDRWLPCTVMQSCT